MKSTIIISALLTDESQVWGHHISAHVHPKGFGDHIYVEDFLTKEEIKILIQKIKDKLPLPEEKKEKLFTLEP